VRARAGPDDPSENRQARMPKAHASFLRIPHSRSRVFFFLSAASAGPPARIRPRGSHARRPAPGAPRHRCLSCPYLLSRSVSRFYLSPNLPLISPIQWLLDAVTSPLVYVTVGIAVGVRVVGTSESMSTVVALSALPVVGLSVLARTPAGAALQAAATAKAEASRAGEQQRLRDRAAARASRRAEQFVTTPHFSRALTRLFSSFAARFTVPAVPSGSALCRTTLTPRTWTGAWWAIAALTR
jgi:hypothetical protein